MMPELTDDALVPYRTEHTASTSFTTTLPAGTSTQQTATSRDITGELLTQTKSNTNSLRGMMGLSVGNAFPYLSDAQLNSYLDDIASLGVTWLRFDISWNDVQYENADIYDWTPSDRVVTAARARGLKLLPILLYTPAWARDPSCPRKEHCAPVDQKLFAEFAARAAERYARQGVHHWEIWNEPNVGAWQPRNNLEGYAEMLVLTSRAIKAANPSAIIVTGGLAPAETRGTDISPLDFLEGLYARGAGKHFDAVGHHPYTYPVTATHIESWNAWLQMAKTQRSLRSIMTANGDGGKKIWSTEYGAPTGGPEHVSEELQALILSDALKVHATQPWSGPFFWYSYIDAGSTTETNENFFGLRRFDNSKKPSYEKLKDLLASPD